MITKIQKEVKQPNILRDSKATDELTQKRLEDARAKFKAAKVSQKAVVLQAHKHDTTPDVIAWSFKVKTGPNKGQIISGKSVGFRSLANPASDYLAVKLKIPHVRAILACVDAGKRQELEDLITIYEEERKQAQETDTEETEE